MAKGGAGRGQGRKPTPEALKKKSKVMRIPIEFVEFVDSAIRIFRPDELETVSRLQAENYELRRRLRELDPAGDW